MKNIALALLIATGVATLGAPCLIQVGVAINDAIQPVLGLVEWAIIVNLAAILAR